MSWTLQKIPSHSGEQPSSESKIGFRGSRFTISSQGDLIITDYDREKTVSKKSITGNFVNQVVEIMGGRWSGRIRIRCNGDVYSSGERNLYLGNINYNNSNEPFEGYSIFNKDRGPASLENLQIYEGPHNHGQVGERWTIAPDSFSSKSGNLGNVGIKYEKGNWMWSQSKHDDFINKIRKKFVFDDWVRFYITSTGFIVKPIDSRYFQQYGINIQSELKHLISKCSKSARSVQKRMNNSKVINQNNSTVYFICGHVDDLMNGRPPIPDMNDPRTGQFNQQYKRWG